MRSRTLPVALLFAVLGGAVTVHLSGAAAAAAQKKTAAKTTAKAAPKAPSKAAPKGSSRTAAKTVPRKPTASARGSSARRKSAARQPAPRRPAGQQQPTPERYAEIQQALISRGYLAGPATGKWGPESVEALKRFEKDQNFEPDGKLDSWVLIALGLGPKRASSVQTQAQPDQP